MKLVKYIILIFFYLLPFFYADVIDSIVYSHDIVFDTGSASHSRFKFAIFNITFSIPYYFHLYPNTTDSFTDSVSPETAIRCSCYSHVFDSLSSKNQYSLFFIGDDIVFFSDLHKFVNQLYSYYSKNNKNVLLAGLLIQYFHDDEKYDAFPINYLESCKFQFLSKEQQIHKPKVFMNFKNDNDYTNSFIDDVKFRHIQNPNEIIVDSIDPQAIISSANFAASSLLRSGSDNNINKCTTQSDEQFTSFLSEQITLTGGGIGGLVSSIAKPVVSPLGEVVGGIMSDGIGAMVGDSLGRNLEATYTDTIANELSESLAPAITQVLVPSLTETVTDTLTASLSESLRDFLTESLSAKITSELTTRLAKTVSVSVPEKVNSESPKELAIKLTKQLGHLLTRSLSHTIIPSLIHTISHSPLHDYYCYFCYHHKEYCEYCQYQPSQIYYALNYAGYYSTYISDYYSTYFSNALSKQLELSERRRKQAVADRDRYEIVLEV